MRAFRILFGICVLNLSALRGALSASGLRANRCAKILSYFPGRKSNMSPLPVVTTFEVSAQRLQYSSFVVMTYFFLRVYSGLPKKELLLSLWVRTLERGPREGPNRSRRHLGVETAATAELQNTRVPTSQPRGSI